MLNVLSAHTEGINCVVGMATTFLTNILLAHILIMHKLASAMQTSPIRTKALVSITCLSLQFLTELDLRQYEQQKSNHLVILEREVEITWLSFGPQNSKQHDCIETACCVHSTLHCLHFRKFQLEDIRNDKPHLVCSCCMCMCIYIYKIIEGGISQLIYLFMYVSVQV